MAMPPSTLLTASAPSPCAAADTATATSGREVTPPNSNMPTSAWPMPVRTLMTLA